LDRATSIGRPDLFAPDALDLIVHQACGSPHVLLSIASLAFFTAAWGGATQIGARHVAYWLRSEFVEDSAAPQGEILRRESANHVKATHRSGYERDAYRSIRGLIGEGRAVIARLPKRVPLGRVRPLTGATAAIAASIGLAVVVAAFLVGGNDAGFADVLTECALPGWASNCNGAINGAQNIINNTLPNRLSTLYAGIRSRATVAKVVVVGYPRIFMGEDCNAFTWFSPAEETRLNQTADLLNSKLSAAAGAQGFSFADPTSRFIGHAVCDNPEWLNGLSNPISESYHPNRTGHSSGYAPLVSPLLTGAPARITAAVLESAGSSAAALAVQQRQYAALDRTIRPEQFRVPDLQWPVAYRYPDVVYAQRLDLAVQPVSHTLVTVRRR
jgi:hypothetical protein